MYKNNASDFTPGDSVIYIPGHARGDKNHADCEHGVVSSINHAYVFVKYSSDAMHGIATDPNDLVKP